MFRERKEEREIVNVALEIEEKTKPNQTLDFFRATKGNFVLFCFVFSFSQPIFALKIQTFLLKVG